MTNTDLHRQLDSWIDNIKLLGVDGYQSKAEQLRQAIDNPDIPNEVIADRLILMDMTLRQFADTKGILK